MNRPRWQRWAAGPAAGALITASAGSCSVNCDLQVGWGFLGFAIPIAICGVAGSVAVKIAGW
jgi:hypothetical protein